MYEKVISTYLDKYFETLDNKKVKEIIKYSVKGGKCIRGFIVKHIIEKLGDKNNPIRWEPIVAVELIHAASLIIDDLPCMDNDIIRRNKPSTFIQYGKHEAILFSFYIISESIKLLNIAIHSPESLNIMISEWCELLGKNLVIGQLMDINSDATEFFNIKKNNYNDDIIKYKTCSLFSFTFILGAIFTRKKLDLDEFKQIGFHFGMMFQLVDDYKDREEDNKDANYILQYGPKKSLQKYKNERFHLIQLLEKNDLLTPEFVTIISTLDASFIPDEQSQNHKTTCPYAQSSTRCPASQ